MIRLVSPEVPIWFASLLNAVQLWFESGSGRPWDTGICLAVDPYVTGQPKYAFRGRWVFLWHLSPLLSIKESYSNESAHMRQGVSGD